MLQNIL